MRIKLRSYNNYRVPLERSVLVHYLLVPGFVPGTSTSSATRQVQAAGTGLHLPVPGTLTVVALVNS